MNFYDQPTAGSQSHATGDLMRNTLRVWRLLAFISFCTFCLSLAFSAVDARYLYVQWHGLPDVKDLRGLADPQRAVEWSVTALRESVVSLIWLLILTAALAATTMALWMFRRWSRRCIFGLFGSLLCVLAAVSLLSLPSRGWLSADAYNMSVVAWFVSLVLLIVWSPRFDPMVASDGSDG
jgi:hypothetical protein